MNRNQGNSSWTLKAAIYMGAMTAAAAGAGALLGLAGSHIGADTRAALATAAALAGVVIGLTEFAGGHVHLIQRDKETPQSWVHSGPLRWAALNGAALGVAAGSRLGFWLWYAIPVGSLLGGSVLLGAATYGVYGIVRGSGAVTMLLLAAGRGSNLNQLAVQILSWRSAMRRAAAAQLALLGLFVAFGSGVYGL